MKTSKSTEAKELKTPIKKEELEELIKAQATRKEIINYYEGNSKALEDFSLITYGLDFNTLYKKLIATGKIEIRKKLLDVAMNSEARTSKHQLSTLIYLSKCYLDLAGENATLGRGNMSNRQLKENIKADTPIKKSFLDSLNDEEEEEED